MSEKSNSVHNKWCSVTISDSLQALQLWHSQSTCLCQNQNYFYCTDVSLWKMDNLGNWKFKSDINAHMAHQTYKNMCCECCEPYKNEGEA